MENRSDVDEPSPGPALTLEGHLETIHNPAVSDTLALRYHKEFGRTPNQDLLDRAILCARRTVEICPPENPRQPRYFVRVANYLESRHRRSDFPEVEDLADALWYLDLASKSSHLESETARDKAKRLAITASCHQRLYQGGNEVEYEPAIDATRDAAVAWETVDDKDRIAMAYHDFGHLYVARFERDKDKDPGLLDRSIECIEKTIQAIDKTSKRWEVYHREKITFLERRAAYNLAKREKDYRAAIEGCRMLMKECNEPEYDPQTRSALFQHWLGRLYIRLATVTDNKEDLHKATYNLQRASEDTPRDDPEWQVRFDALQEALETFTAKLGQPPGLNGTILAQQEYVAKILTSAKEEDQGEPQAQALYKLAVFHQLRYMRRHTIDDLITTTEHLHNAVAKTSETDYEKLLQRLGLAADCYHILYSDENDPKYLRLGIETGERAVDVVYRAGGSVCNRKKGAVYYTLERCLAALADEEDDDGLRERAIRAGESAAELLGRED